MFSQKELAPVEDQGVVFGIVQAVRQLHPRPDEAVHARRSTTSTSPSRRRTASSRSRSPPAASAAWSPSPGASATKTTEQLLMESCGPSSPKIPGVRVIPHDAGAPARRRRLPGGLRDRLHRRARSSSCEFANQLVGKAFASGLFIFADADLKFDQPQAEVVFDRDKVRSQGVDLSQAGRDLSTMLGGDYVNRFSIQGRSYKVIPQVKRSERLTPDQLARDPRHGPGRQAGAALDLRHASRPRREPRELKRFQQLNAVRIQGVIPPQRLARPGPDLPGDRGADASCRQGFTIDYAGESRQLRTEGSKFLGDVPALRRSSSTWCWPRSSRASAIRSSSSPARCRWPSPGALLFSFLGLHHAQHLQPGRAHHAGRPRVEERHPDRGVREPPAGDRAWTSCAPSSRPPARACGPILMTTAATVVGHFPLVLATGPGAGARNSIGIMLVSGMIIGTALHAVRGAVDLRAGGPDADGRRPGGDAGGRARGAGARRSRKSAATGAARPRVPRRQPARAPPPPGRAPRARPPAPAPAARPRPGTRTPAGTPRARAGRWRPACATSCGSSKSSRRSRIM